MVLTTVMRQVKCECVNRHDYAKEIVGDDRMGRCFAEHTL